MLRDTDLAQLLRGILAAEDGEPCHWRERDSAGRRQAWCRKGCGPSTGKNLAQSQLRAQLCDWGKSLLLSGLNIFTCNWGLIIATSQECQEEMMG